MGHSRTGVASPGRPVLPAEQKIGDYFAACMDETAVNAQGAKPLKNRPRARSPRMKSVRGSPRILARRAASYRERRIAVRVRRESGFRGLRAGDRLCDRRRTGLPDRDYYTKTDRQIRRDPRRSIVEHIQNGCSNCWAIPPAAATRNAQTVMEIETALAKASLTRVEKRDPYKLYHKITRAQLKALTPSFDWDAYLAESGLPTVSRVINVTEPAFFKEVQYAAQCARISTIGRPICAGIWCMREAPYLSAPFVKANFDFYSKYLRGVPADAAALEALRPAGGSAISARRWARCSSQKTFGPDTKTAHAGDDQGDRSGDGERDRAIALDGRRRPRSRRSRNCTPSSTRSAIPDKWRDYSSVQIERDDFFGNVERADGI